MGNMRHSVALDMTKVTLRQVNEYLHHHELSGQSTEKIEILNPNGMHSIAVGLDAAVDVHICGHAGYYIAGMNKQANVTVHGNVGWGVAENIMSGMVRVKGNASECAASSGHGGLVVIEGDASSRCGISMKGCDIIVGGSIGHVSGFMAQAGHLVVCGDAGLALGDSLYEAIIYVRGQIASLGADAREEAMADADHAMVAKLLKVAGFDFCPSEFKRIASAKTLYHWNTEHRGAYG